MNPDQEVIDSSGKVSGSLYSPPVDGSDESQEEFDGAIPSMYENTNPSLAQSYKEMSEAPQQEEEDSHNKRETRTRKNVPVAKRISELTYQKRALEEQLAQKEYHYQQQLADQQRQLQERDRLLREKEENELSTLENTLNANEAIALAELERSKEDMDVKEEMRWQKYLNDLQKEQMRVQTKKASKRSDDDDYGTYKEPIPMARPQYNRPQAPAEYLDWVERTPWANPNDPNYSPDLVNEAIQKSVEIDKRLRIQGQAHYIGTPEYYDTLNTIMNDQYGSPSEDNGKDNSMAYQDDAEFGQYDDGHGYGHPSAPMQMPHRSSAPQHYQQQPQYQQQRPQYGSPSVPASRSGSTMADQYARQNPQGRTGPRVQLTPEQEMIARNLRIKKADGSYMRPDEARARYIKHMNAPLNPEGSPHKLIFNY